MDKVDPRAADIAEMLRQGATVADIMLRHSCGYTLIQRIRQQEGIQPASTGPRAKPAVVSDGDRKLYHNQEGKCYFCDVAMQTWERVAGRKPVAVALCCKVCYVRWSPLIWRDKEFENARGLRSLYPPKGVEPVLANGGTYVHDGVRHAAMYRESKPDATFIEVGGKEIPVPPGRVEYPG